MLPEGDTVWLCGVHRREDGSQDDAFKWFADLHALGLLLPTDDDHLRDRAEAAIRLHRALTSDLCRLIDRAMAGSGEELTSDLCGWLPCRSLVVHSGDVEEIWCALSILDVERNFVRETIRDLLFAELEKYVAPAIFEARNDWPAGELEWSEVVRLGLR